MTTVLPPSALREAQRDFCGDECSAVCQCPGAGAAQSVCTSWTCCGARVADDVEARPRIAQAALQACVTVGLMTYAPSVGPRPIPVSLFPTPVLRFAFEKAVSLAVPFAGIVERVARDETWLLESFRDVTAAGDEFTAGLVDIFQRHGGARARQRARLSILRSDYMVERGTGRLLQVELNTVSCGLAGLAPAVTRFHEMMMRGALRSEAAARGVSEDRGELPTNTSDVEVAAALAAARSLYCSQRGARCPARSRNAVILFVVQPDEWNVVDQRRIEELLASVHGVPVARATLDEVASRAAVVRGGPDDGVLVLDASLEVTVAYFRSGYDPKDYASGASAWTARARIEESLAVKCPDIAVHLVGAKKVQQRLASEPGALERFLDKPEDVELVRSCFAGLWSLGPDADAAVIARAATEPHKFVLKPQREGGGNNLYDANVRDALISMPRDQLAAFILMERISAELRQGAVFVRPAQPLLETESTAELGIYSVSLAESDSGNVYFVKPAGHLLRSKAAATKEGGLASGSGVIDSPFLI